MNNTIHPGGPTVPQPSTPNAKPAAAGDADGRASATPVQAGDQVQLTESARALGAATCGADAPVDAQRVQRIRQAIAEGSYQLDPQRVADHLIALEKQVGG